jgi:flavin-dependent dehydrogenase
VPERATYDVVVIGGGPGGSCTAGYLARRGFSVALIERCRHPRYAVGESLLPHIWRFLDALGVTPSVEREDFVHKRGVTARWGDVLRQFEFSWFGHDRPALIVERDRFDEILFRHAASLGVTTLEGVSISSIRTGERSSVVRTLVDGGDCLYLSCRVVVDATGQAGVISTKKGRRIENWAGRESIFLWGYFRDDHYVAPGGLVRRGARTKGGSIAATSYMCEYEGGWALHLPLRERSFVGLCTRRPPAGDGSPAILQDLYLKSLGHVPYFEALLRGAEYEEGSLRSLAGFSFRSRRLSGPGYFLVGDAAAYTDPIFAHGVQFAVYSAYCAAGAIERKIRGSRAGTDALYGSQLRQHYEMSRALAYGDAEGDTPVHPSVVNLLRWMPANELDLLCTSAAITGRSKSFARLAVAAGVTASERVRSLEGLRA